MTPTAKQPARGYSCNRCNQFHLGPRIPNRCTNCRGVEFRIERSLPHVNFDLEPFTCPSCGHSANMDRFQCGGADDGNVICPKCFNEFATPPLLPVEVERRSGVVQKTMFESEPA